MVMLEWFGKMIGLPSDFLPFTEGGNGGGVIQVRLILTAIFNDRSAFCEISDFFFFLQFVVEQQTIDFNNLTILLLNL